jgi:hypothetical protein
VVSNALASVAVTAGNREIVIMLSPSHTDGRRRLKEP